MFYLQNKIIFTMFHYVLPTIAGFTMFYLLQPPKFVVEAYLHSQTCAARPRVRTSRCAAQLGFTLRRSMTRQPKMVIETMNGCHDVTCIDAWLYLTISYLWTNPGLEIGGPDGSGWQRKWWQTTCQWCLTRHKWPVVLGVGEHISCISKWDSASCKASLRDWNSSCRVITSNVIKWDHFSLFLTTISHH